MNIDIKLNRAVMYDVKLDASINWSIWNSFIDLLFISSLPFKHNIIIQMYGKFGVLHIVQWIMNEPIQSSPIYNYYL